MSLQSKQQRRNEEKEERKWRPFQEFNPYLSEALHTRKKDGFLRPAITESSKREKWAQTDGDLESVLPGVLELKTLPSEGGKEYMRHRSQLAPTITVPSGHHPADLPDNLPPYETIYHLFGYGKEQDPSKLDHFTHGRIR